MNECTICAPGDTVFYHQGDSVRVFECGDCGLPLVVATDHDDDPDNRLKTYALGVVCGLFGPDASLAIPSHPEATGHWNKHVSTQ